MDQKWMREEPINFEDVLGTITHVKAVRHALGKYPHQIYLRALP
jgi:hypothetical protein